MGTLTKINRGSTMSYGGRSRGKTNHGDGGFNGMPTVSLTRIDQAKWDSIDWSDYKREEECQDES